MMNMEEIYKIETIEQYNNMYGFKTMHPLVAYVEFNESNSKFIPGRHTMGFYSLFLKETKGCVINYGKTKYDFDGQTIVSIAPDQGVGTSQWQVSRKRLRESFSIRTSCTVRRLSAR